MMMHLLRLFFLLVSVCGLGFVWGHGAHPEWVDRADRWFCDEHLEEPQAVGDWISESAGASEAETQDLRKDLERYLQKLGPVSNGERRFPLWRELVIWQVEQARNAKDLTQALAWQSLLVEQTPGDMGQGILLVSLLMEKGRPKDLERAQEILTTKRLALPEWAPALEAQMRLALVQKNWDALLDDLQELQAIEGRALGLNWQWIYKLQGEDRLQVSARLDSCPSQDGSHQELTLALAPGQSLASLRVDPPAGAQGTLWQVRFVGLRRDGQPEPLVPGVAKDCDWSAADGRLHLTGESDPRINVAPGKVDLKEVQVHFQVRAPLPAWLKEEAAGRPKLRARLLQQGWSLSDAGGSR